MDRSTTYPTRGSTRVSPDFYPLKPSPVKARKSSRIGSVLRKLLGRKTIKSQISLPTPTKQQSDGPSDFITSAVDTRYQRAQSLPVHKVSRNSALGSHAPLLGMTEEKLVSNSTLQHADSPARPRRASMPGTYNSTPEPFADRTLAHNQADEEDYRQRLDEANIGFAITSGSHPKRRSRSAGALRESAAASHRMSPIQWQHNRRRSDEIRYWRDSVGNVPTIDPDTGTPAEKQQDGPEHDLPSLVFEYKETVDDEAEPEESASQNRQTFDFGLFASSMNEGEQIPIEERVTTVEIKLMDLEYAISKIQRTPSSQIPHSNAQSKPPTPTFSSSLQTPTSAPRRSTSVNSKTMPSNGSTNSNANTFSTQATAPSLHTIPQSAVSIPDPAPFSTRPASAATTLHQPTQVVPNSPSPPQALPVHKSTTDAPAPKRNSITSITIDHYTTLINLIRREQAARIRLEDQVAELQRELFQMHGGRGSTTSIPEPVFRSQYGGSRKDLSYSGSRKDLVHGGQLGGDMEGRGMAARRMPSYSDATSTEDGFQDVFETPVEDRVEGGLF